MSHCLVVGCDGMLGQDLVAALGESAGANEVTGVHRHVLDVIDPGACLATVFVVSVAAWTAADDAESLEARALTLAVAAGAGVPA